MKREIFKPIFMNFPVLDRLGSWIPSRVLARQLVEQFSKVLQARLLQSHDVEACSLSSQKLGARLVAARRNDLLTEKQFRDNLNVTFVAGQENPQLLMISVLYLLGKHPVCCVLRAYIPQGPY
jgi:unspecific monooxygenase